MRFDIRSITCVTWLALVVIAPHAASADDDRCVGLAGATLDDVTIESATPQREGQLVEGATIPDPSGVSPTPEPVAGLPAFCRVIGSVQPEAGSHIGFEVWLPREHWDGRFLGGNNGGFAGYISYSDLAGAVAAGHAGASTDTGHVGSSQIDSAWANGHPERVRDFGWRAVHVTTVVAKQLIRAYYGRNPDHSYFIGCSNGGRQGLMEAWRFPDDYDGIIAGAPGSSFTALASTFSSTVQAQLPEGAALRAEQLPLLQSEVLRQCDALDGQVDGLIAAPWACQLDTAPLACGAASEPACFTAPQLAALAQISAGRRDRRGRTLAAGFQPSGVEAGAPTTALGWAGWLLAGEAAPPAQALFARGILQDFAPELGATPETFDFDRDLRALQDVLGQDIDVQPRLGRFFAQGGKLILWQGLADPAVSPQQTFALHQTLARGAHADDALRLFMAPGVLHCGYGTGPDLFGQNSAPPPGAAPERNLAAALEAWVESGRVPDRVIGGYSVDEVSDGAPARERLLCAFPSHATLRAGADPNRSESYECRD